MAGQLTMQFRMAVEPGGHPHLDISKKSPVEWNSFMKNWAQKELWKWTLLLIDPGFGICKLCDYADKPLTYIRQLI